MKATFDAAGSVVIITGGANGIGRATALAIAERGGQSIVFDVADAHDLAETYGITVMHVDIADPVAVEDAVARVIADFGHIDGLIAGAAVQPRTPVLDMSTEEWRRVVSINLDGVVWVSRSVARHMRARRSGSIVMFTSGMALTGYPGASAYVSTKAALIGFSKSLAAELAPHRVRVNLVSPGVIDTPQFRSANVGADLGHWKNTTGVGEPTDVVLPLLFLLSDAATMTGSQLTRERVFSAEETS